MGILGLNNSFAVLVDTTAPTVGLPTYTNGTSKKNTQSLTLNISISDATSGLAGGICIFDVNGTNQTLAISGGWCNSTAIALTGLSDGNRTIKVFVNDSANNIKLNNSFVVQIDTTAPSATASCTPETVNSGDVVTCTCSGSDATSGVASSTATSTPSTSNTGTFSYSCTVTDNAGNSASNSDSYTVEIGGGTSSSGGGGGGGSSTSFWTAGTFSVSNEQITQGHSTQISVKQRVKMQISDEDHYVGVREITSTSAKIEVSSTPQEKTIAIGEEWKVEVTGDNYYDLNVKLNSIENNKASIFMLSIHELMPVVEEPVEEEVVQQEETPSITGEAIGDTEGGSNLLWLWLLIAAIVVGFVIWAIKRNKH